MTVRFVEQPTTVASGGPEWLLSRILRSPNVATLTSQPLTWLDRADVAATDGSSGACHHEYGPPIQAATIALTGKTLLANQLRMMPPDETSRRREAAHAILAQSFGLTALLFCGRTEPPCWRWPAASTRMTMRFRGAE